MFGEDSCGRKVSLLNDRSSTATTTTTFTRPKLPTRSRPSTSSVSSFTSREGHNSPRSSPSDSPRHSHSPPTPPSLVRLNSSSQSSLTRSTPSPMTPQYGFEPMDQHMKRDQNVHPYYNQAFNTAATNNARAIANANGYASMQDLTPQAYYNLSTQQPLPPMNDFDLDSHSYDPTNVRTPLQPLQTQFQNAAYPTDPLVQMSPQATFPTPSSASTATSITLPPSSTAPPATPTPVKPDPTTPTTANPSSAATATSQTPAASTIKKKYPCPHAARFSCIDTFTTSGHAARHGKKHTGEKNILCPTCNKAFTRKDNMKQHERTHKGSSSSKSGSTAGSPVIGSKAVLAGSRKGSVSADENAGSDTMDITHNGGLSLGNDSSDGSSGVIPKRPKIQRSELSEIIEGISKGQQQQQMSMEHHDGDMDADGEGESPGLDALATAASGMA